MNLKLYSLTLSCNTSLDYVDRIKSYFQEYTGLITQYAISKKTIQNFQIRKNSKIGFFIKLWGKKANKFLNQISQAKIKLSGISKFGVLTFGIPQYIKIPKIKYNPDLPMFGFTINLLINRIGWGISKKRRNPKKVKSLKISKIKEFVNNNFKSLKL
jgi:large subunit ribosomal protein L5